MNSKDEELGYEMEFRGGIVCPRMTLSNTGVSSRYIEAFLAIDTKIKNPKEYACHSGPIRQKINICCVSHGEPPKEVASLENSQFSQLLGQLERQ